MSHLATRGVQPLQTRGPFARFPAFVIFRARHCRRPRETPSLSATQATRERVRAAAMTDRDKTKTGSREAPADAAATQGGVPARGAASAPARATSDAEVADFVRRMKELAPRTAAGRGRLAFAMDATMSRQPTWDMALALQADMFKAVKAIGGLDVQLVYFRGNGECRASQWVSRPRCAGRPHDARHLRRRLHADPQGALPRARGGGQEAGQRAGLRRRLHGGGRRRPVRPRRRAGPARRAGVPVPGGRRRHAPSKPSARSPASPRAPIAASMPARPRS